MALNQVNIMSALTTNPAERKKPNFEKNFERGKVICFRCEEKGHIARKCLSEKVMPQENWRSKNNDANKREVNMLEQEVFPAIRRKRSESQRETTTRRTRSKPNEPMEISEEIPETIVNNTTSTPRRRIPRGPSILDNIEPYNIWDDLVNVKANVNIGQMMQCREQQRKLLQIMR